MFKFLFLVLAAVVVANGRTHRYRRQEPNLRSQATELYNNAKEDFPMEEFTTFLGKIREKSGMTADEIKAKFEANKGDMDVTLEQLFDKAQENYPILTQQWNRIQATWADKKDDMVELKGEKFSGLYAKAKTFLEEKYGQSINIEDFKSKISGYLATIGINAPSRRFKRETNLREAYSQAEDRFHENFPKAEFEAFLGKLAENSQSTRDEIKAKLDANKGNMDLTLEEVADKAKSDYPLINQQWAKIKAQWEGIRDDMDETSLQDLFEKAKTHLESKFGPVDFQGFYNKIKDYVAAMYAGPPSRRYKREISTAIRPHIETAKQHFGDNFPKAEWDAFYSKLEPYLKETGIDLKEEIQKHDGNMDMTLEDLKEDLGEKYPQFQEKWATVKEQLDECLGRMDDTTVRELFSTVKLHAEKLLGEPINENKLKDFLGNIQSYFMTLKNRLGAVTTW